MCASISCVRACMCFPPRTVQLRPKFEEEVTVIILSFIHTYLYCMATFTKSWAHTRVWWVRDREERRGCADRIGYEWGGSETERRGESVQRELGTGAVGQRQSERACADRTGYGRS